MCLNDAALRDLIGSKVTTLRVPMFQEGDRLFRSQEGSLATFKAVRLNVSCVPWEMSSRAGIRCSRSELAGV